MNRYVVETQGRNIRHEQNVRRYNFSDIAAAVLKYSQLKASPDVHKVRLMIVIEETEVTR